MKKVLGLFIVLLLLFTASLSGASTIWGTDATGELIGNRSSFANCGIDATEQWDNGGFLISWDISQQDNLWTYNYTVIANQKDVSHLIMEVTEGRTINMYEGTSPHEGPGIWSLSPSNPQMPNSIYGVKFDYGSTNALYTIVTDRAPVYGIFYAKDGKTTGADVVAWSSALNYSDYQTIGSLTTTDYIVRPNGATPVPEPTTILLLGSGLIGFAIMRRQAYTSSTSCGRE